MYADVNADLVTDYCRFVGNPPDVFLSCQFGCPKSGGMYGYPYGLNSVQGIDQGYCGTQMMRDINFDSRADFCRTVGDAPNEFISCNLATATGFDPNQYTVNLPPNTPMFSTAIVDVEPWIPVPGQPVTVTVQITNNLPFIAPGYAQVTLTPLSGGAVQTAEGPVPYNLTLQPNQTITQTVSITPPAYGQYSIYSAFDDYHGQDAPYLASKSPAQTLNVPAPPPIVPTVLNLAAMNVKGPVTLQGQVPWTCSQGGNGGFANSACPVEFFSKTFPHWVSGDGFTVNDLNQNPNIPKIYVPNSSIDLQASASFTDDTAAVQIPWSVTVETAPPVTYSYARSLFAGALEGNHGKYSLRVQQWVNLATSCPPAQASQDPDYPPVPFNVPSPTGSSGCWVDIGSASTDLYGPSYGAPSGTIAGTNATVSTTLSIPVTLPQVSTYLRYVVGVWEGDSRVDTTPQPAGWTQTQDLVTGSWMPTPPFDHTRDNEFFYGFTIWHPSASQFSYAQALNPFQVVVLPVALAQLKVLPYTLLYAPPGDASKGTYATTTSYGMSMAVDSKLATNQATTVDNKDTAAESVGAGSGKGDLSDLLGGGSLGATLSASQSWDHSTKTGTGTITDVATNQSTTYQSVASFTLSNPNSVPGATGTYATRVILERYLRPPRSSAGRFLAVERRPDDLVARCERGPREPGVLRADRGGPRPVLSPDGDVRRGNARIRNERRAELERLLPALATRPLLRRGAEESTRVHEGR